MRRVTRALTCALVLIGTLSVATAPSASAAESRAVVVIDTGAGSRRVIINFSGTITGIQALQLAGANPTLYGFSGQGVAVCALDGVGHAADDSCLGTPSDGRYWAYFRASGGAGSWTYARGGAGSATVSDGDVEGWRFGTGQPPPFSSFCDVVGCAPPPTSPPPAPGGASNAGSGGSLGAAPGGSVAPSTTSGDAPATESVVTTPPTEVSTPSATVPRRNGRSGQALGVPTGGPDDGSGSPWGLIVAVAVAFSVVTAAVVRRRHRSAA